MNNNRYIKKLGIFLSMILYCVLPDCATGQWVVQQSNTNETLYSVCFLDTLNGWILGTGSTILHTTNGGNVWEKQSAISGATRCISFCDTLNGWIVGPAGILFKTSDGGKNWNQILYDTSKFSYGRKVQCLSPASTVVLCYRWTGDTWWYYGVYRTDDSGKT
jgi:photosystem II stability/assembly factor-like uncharacterized protein